MQTFKQWLYEQVATKSFIGNNIINNDNNDDGGDDDGDDNWSWDKLNRFDNKLIDWCANDPFAKKIKNKIIELIFKKQPEIDVKEYYGDDDTEHEFSSSGTIVLNVEWKMPVDDISDSLFVTLRKSTVWKPLEIQPNELWNTLDKGDIFEYIYYHIKSAILGRNVAIYNQHYHAERPNYQRLDPEYFSKHNEWRKDKQTLEKYTRFILYQKKDELLKFVEDYLPFEAVIQENRQRINAVVWDENFIAQAYIDYNYKKI